MNAMKNKEREQAKDMAFPVTVKTGRYGRGKGVGLTRQADRDTSADA
jgi:hypothetical protein